MSQGQVSWDGSRLPHSHAEGEVLTEDPRDHFMPKPDVTSEAPTGDQR